MRFILQRRMVLQCDSSPCCQRSQPTSKDALWREPNRSCHRAANAQQEGVVLVSLPGAHCAKWCKQCNTNRQGAGVEKAVSALAAGKPMIPQEPTACSICTMGTFPGIGGNSLAYFAARSLLGSGRSLCEQLRISEGVTVATCQVYNRLDILLSRN